MRRRGLLVVISGPAGSGKSTLADGLLARSGPDVCRAVTTTTRGPRPGEVDGVDYNFLSEGDFRQGVRDGAFVEHTQFNNNFYGTMRKTLEASLSADKVVLLVIDVKGAMEIRNAYPQAVLIFVLPPNPDNLRKRLHKRGTESQRDIENRLVIAEAEVDKMDHYDYLVINDNVDDATDDLCDILHMARVHHIRGGEREAWVNGAYSGWHTDRPAGPQPV